MKALKAVPDRRFQSKRLTHNGLKPLKEMKVQNA